MRILIVDDYEPWRRYVRSILADDADLEIVGESADGLDAIKQSEELQPGLVLLDINLPGINGLEVSRRVYGVAPETKVLFVSSSQSVEVMREALKNGAGFVIKSDAQRDLLPIVQVICKNQPFVRFRLLDDGSSDRDKS